MWATAKPISMGERRQRFEDIARVLGNFSQLREPGRYAHSLCLASGGTPCPNAGPDVAVAGERERRRSREDYIQQLITDLCEYYGYSEYLMTKLSHIFPVSEVRHPFVGGNILLKQRLMLRTSASELEGM